MLPSGTNITEACCTAFDESLLGTILAASITPTLAEKRMAMPLTHAASPTRALLQAIRAAAKRFSDHDMSTYASALAFQAFFSLFPFLIFLIALLAFLQLPQFFDWLIAQTRLLVPAQSVDQVTQVIEQVRSPSSTLLSFGAVGALWTASAGVRATMTALNVAYEVRERRPAWKRALLSVLYTVSLALLLIAAGILFSIGPDAASWILVVLHLPVEWAELWSWLRWPLWLLLLFSTVTLVYYVSPHRRQVLRRLLPGAAIALAAWVATSLAFGYYLANFANYSAVYGSIGTVIGLLLYFSLSASVLLFGAEINAVLERGPPSRNPDALVRNASPSPASNLH